MESGFSRRGFVVGAAATASAAAVPSVAQAKRRKRRRTTVENHEAVVIGSGFAGSVTSLRLAKRGVKVTMLERGMRWPTGPNAETFARGFQADKRASWMSHTAPLSKLELGYWDKYAGVVERITGNGIDIVCGSAVGGSSITYHAVTLQPDGDIFSRVMPSELDYQEMAAKFYPKVAAMLKLQAAPDDVINHERYRTSKNFLEDAEKAGLPAKRLSMAVDWSWVQKELRGEVKPSMSTGDCLYGVNNSGKNSLDTNYIPAAESTGNVNLLPLHWVKEIEHGPNGTYVVVVDQIAPDGKLIERKRMITKALFMCAGSANTTRLLMRAKAKGTLQDLPDDVGGYWGNNGDRVFARITIPGTRTSAFQGGPACVAIMDVKNPKGPVSLLNGGLPFPDLGATSIIGVAIPDKLGSWIYDAAKDDAIVQWDDSAQAASTKLIKDRLDQLISVSGGVTIDTTPIDSVTYHPLGGAVMGKVTDGYGRVQGHRGLYVMDGSLIPGSTACVNPSMTIAAVAERNISKIVKKDLGKVF